jgi:glycosyltransferase involved in cell wall biosynthesis
MKKVKKLSIVISCYNEKSTINKVIDKIMAVDLGTTIKEIVIIDDFSHDGTRTILQNIAKKNESVQLIFQDHNQGKGAALKRGIQKTTGDVVVVQDADLEYNPQDYLVLLRPIERSEVDAVFGSRFISGATCRNINRRSLIANKFLTGLSNLFNDLKLTDMETCYKMVRGDLMRTIAQDLRAQRFGFEPELTARLAKSKVSVREVGISYNGRTKEDGKKINFKDGMRAIWEIVYFNTTIKPSSRRIIITNDTVKANNDKQ